MVKEIVVMLLCSEELMKFKKNKKRIVYTIGHSTRSLDDFIALVRENGITQLIDIRTIPKSRHNPQFNKEVLSRALRNRRIGYRHMKGLGGLRHAKKDSINMAWQNVSFRGFADYMQTDAFEKNLKKLMHYARKKQTAIMCAEAVPWRCHRSLIGDALLIHGFDVENIMSHTKTEKHVLTAWAQVRGDKIWYPKAA
jgi:uncharacterized protein (DUF488 family)